MLKKITCVILSVLLLFPTFSLVSASSSSENFAQFEENIKFLQSLDALDTGVLNGQMFVSRAQFVEYVIRLMGIQISNGQTSFSDVYTIHGQYPYIVAAEEYGLIKGNGGGLMRPDDTITQWEASVICVRALCYDDIIRLGLSMETAVLQSDIAKGVSGNLLNMENAFIMLKNLSNEYILEQTVFSNEQVKFAKSEKTFLDYYRNIKRSEGVVSSNATTSLTNDEGAGENFIAAGSLKFNSQKTPYAQELLGYYSEIYYYDDNKREVVYAAPISAENKTLVIDAGDIIGYDNLELKYHLETEQKSVRLNIDADVLYNFSPCIPYTADDFKIIQGRLRLISNNNDNIYDCVFIEEFETYIVGETSSTGIITCKFTNDILTFDDDLYEYTFVDCDGNAFDEKILREWDVLCIYKSKGGKKHRVVKCSSEIEGEVSEINGTDVYINGRIYKLSDSFVKFGQAVSPGDYFVFYLDACGKIAAYNDAFHSDGFSFAYMIGLSKSKGLDSELSVKLLTQNGEVKVFQFAKTVVIDSQSRSDVNSVYQALGGDSFKSQPARYKLTGGVISCIDTTAPGSGGEADSFHLLYSGYEFTDTDGNPTTVAREVKKLRYKGTPMIFGAKVSLADNVKVAVVPTDVAKVSSDESYRMVDLSYLADDEDYYFAAYKTIPEAHDADYLLLYRDDSNKTELSNKETNISVIDEVSRVIDEDGEETYKLSYYTRGKYYSAYAKETSVIEHINIDGATYLLKKGDIVRLETNADGKVSVCLFVYSPSRDYLNISNPSSDDVNAKPRFQMAYVYEKYGSNIWITRDELRKGESYSYTINDLESKNASKYAIMVYDSAKDYLAIGDVTDIIGYTNTSGTMWSKVFVADRYGNPNTLVIYK